MPTEPVQIEEKEISTESSISLEAAEQDFAVQIQEGQSVRQSIVMDEKRVLTGELSQEISKSESTKVIVSTQPKLSLMASESKDSTALPKEMMFVIQIPKPSSLNIRHQLREALQSAVASDQPVLLADVVGKLQALEVTFEPTSAAVNDPLKLECQVDEDTGVTVTWTRDGKKVHLSMDFLEIPKSKLKDSGKYVCTATNEAGSSSCEAVVTVQGKNLQVITAGKIIWWSIRTASFAPPGLSWSSCIFVSC
uniref:Ig-like domain-containing protein n=1 Tax=Xiphophorus maculatus TaxID=8083 RepID=A0A3B5QC21_XIPMA